MGSIFIYFMPIFAIGCIVYYFLVIPKIKKNINVQYDEVKASLEGREEEVISKYLSDENRFKPILKPLSGEEIIGITDCLKRKSAAEIAKDAAIKAGKNLLESFIRKLTYSAGGSFYRLPNKGDSGYYCLVVTHKSLHYLFFKEGNVKEHQKFLYGEMQNFKQGKANIADQTLKGGGMKLPKISFSTTTDKVTFYHSESIAYYPSGEPLETEATFEANYLFVTPFKNKINELITV